MMIQTLVVLTQLSLLAPPVAEPAVAQPEVAQPEVAQPAVAQPEVAEGPPLPAAMEAAKKYKRIKVLLAQAIVGGDENPETAVPLLEVTLAEIAEFAPQLAADQEALALRANAQVSLARAHLLAGHAAQAAAAMDEAIRSSPSQLLPVDLYGPSIESLWLERSLKVHTGQAIIVKCAIPCRVYVNERRVGPENLQALPVGPYRLWIETPEDAEQTSMRAAVEVGEGDSAIVIQFPPPVAIEGDAAELELGYERRAIGAFQTAKPNADLEGKLARGRTLMVIGGVLLGLGGGAVGLAAASWDSDGSFLASLVGIGFASVLVPGGLVCTVVGGASYGVAKHRLRKQSAGLRVTPTLVGNRRGGSVGFALRF